MQVLAASAAALSDDVGHGVHWLHAYLDAQLHAIVHGSVHWPVPRWPLYVYMAGTMTCLALSAGCHLLGCCSQHVYMSIWRFDYAGAFGLSHLLCTALK